MINIVIPMAGLGSRFVSAGYQLPKPLIPVHGMPMVELVIRNISPAQPHHFTFICRREHEADHGLAGLLRRLVPDCTIVYAEEPTPGAACSILLASKVIERESPLVIANCDQYCTLDMNEFAEELRKLDGLIAVMEARDSKWSYVSLGLDGLVRSVVEKQVISNFATVGIYGFASGAAFCRAARRMIAAEDLVNGEYYVAPVYNYLIAEPARVGVHDVGCEGDGMFGLGTPSDLRAFLRHAESLAIVERERSRRLIVKEITASVI